MADNMTSPNAPAFPVPDAAGAGGLTKREYFAAMVMQGLSANQYFAETTAPLLAGIAVEQTDALIAALNKETAQ